MWIGAQFLTLGYQKDLQVLTKKNQRIAEDYDNDINSCTGSIQWRNFPFKLAMTINSYLVLASENSRMEAMLPQR